MTYSQYGLIEATDFNNFVGNTAATTANQLNTVWGTGTGDAGYGQPPVSQVTQFNLVNATNWSDLILTSRKLAQHQGTNATQITPPNSGDVVQTLAAIQTNLNAVYTNRNNAVAQGSVNSFRTTYDQGTWQSSITSTLTVSWADSSAMRYFFNAGGQITMSFEHPTGSGINPMISQLCAACGTLVLSNITSGTCSIAGSTYTGFTKVGGSGTASTLLTNKGYRGLTTSNQMLFKQFATGTPAGYTGTFISVNMRLNAAVDSATQLIITTLFDMVPNGGTYYPAAPTTTIYLGWRQPSSTYLTKTWGDQGIAENWVGS